MNMRKAAMVFSPLVLASGNKQFGSREGLRRSVIPLTPCLLFSKTKTKIWSLLPTGSWCVGRPYDCRTVYP